MQPVPATLHGLSASPSSAELHTPLSQPDSSPVSVGAARLVPATSISTFGVWHPGNVCKCVWGGGGGAGGVLARTPEDWGRRVHRAWRGVAWRGGARWRGPMVARLSTQCIIGAHRERAQRVCPLCHADGEEHVEDERHVLLECKAYDDIRSTLWEVIPATMMDAMASGDQRGLARVIHAIRLRRNDLTARPI